jgi:hypothetical protein
VYNDDGNIGHRKWSKKMPSLGEPKLKKIKSSFSLIQTSEIQEDHLKHLDIKEANYQYVCLQQFQFNPTLHVLACQDVVFQSNAV